MFSWIASCLSIRNMILNATFRPFNLATEYLYSQIYIFRWETWSSQKYFICSNIQYVNSSSFCFNMYVTWNWINLTPAGSINEWCPQYHILRSPAQLLCTHDYGFFYIVNSSHFLSSLLSAASYFPQNYHLLQRTLLSHDIH